MQWLPCGSRRDFGRLKRRRWCGPMTRQPSSTSSIYSRSSCRSPMGLSTATSGSIGAAPHQERESDSRSDIRRKVLHQKCQSSAAPGDRPRWLVSHQREICFIGLREFLLADRDNRLRCETRCGRSDSWESRHLPAHVSPNGAPPPRHAVQLSRATVDRSGRTLQLRLAGVRRRVYLVGLTHPTCQGDASGSSIADARLPSAADGLDSTCFSAGGRLPSDMVVALDLDIVFNWL